MRKGKNQCEKKRKKINVEKKRGKKERFFFSFSGCKGKKREIFPARPFSVYNQKRTFFFLFCFSFQHMSNKRVRIDSVIHIPDDVLPLVFGFLNECDRGVIQCVSLIW